MSAVQIRRTTPYTPINTNTWYDLEFDTTDIETNSKAMVHDVNYTDKINIYQSGLYRITYQVDNLSNNANHQLETRVRVNDLNVVNGSYLISYDYRSEHVPYSASFLVELNAGDYVTFQVMRTTDNEIINETTMSILKLETGAQGPQGEQGPMGPVGAS